MSWYFPVIKKYAVFSGRARRKEYWMFALFNFLIVLFLNTVDVYFNLLTDKGQPILAGLYQLAVLIPSFAVSIRRMHDTNNSGWMILAPIANIIFVFTGGTHGDNRFGPDPKSTIPNDSKACPYCYETIKSQAIVCKHCGRELIVTKEQKLNGEIVTSPKYVPKNREKRSEICQSCGVWNSSYSTMCIDCEKSTENPVLGLRHPPEAIPDKHGLLNIKCPSCGFWNSNHAMRCLSCGKSLE